MGKSHDLATLKDDGGTLKGSLFVGKDQSGYTSLVKNFSTSHDAANRSKHLRVGVEDGSFTGMLVENTAADNGTHNSQEIKFDTHEGNVSVATRMKIDSRGRVTMPYQPFVHVTASSGGWNGNQTSTIYPFNTVYGGNIGSHFNTSTHKFTCPVAGYYEIIISALAGNGSGHGTLYAAVNDVTQAGHAHQNYNGTANGWHNVVTTAIYSLSANDTLSAYFINSGTHNFYVGGHYSHMTIKLIG